MKTLHKTFRIYGLFWMKATRRNSFVIDKFLPSGKEKEM